ncbi:MAG: SpoIIE family protein phosphatase [Bdellovibrionia bacterium]
MELKLTICAQDQEEGKKWGDQIRESFKGIEQVQVLEGLGRLEEGQILFIDYNLEGLEDELARADRRRQALVLVVRDGSEGSELLLDLLKDGRVDGLILIPFRKLELLGCVRLYEQVVMWNQVGELNASLSQTIQNLSNDVQLAERLQKGCLPKRFTEIKNFQVASKYLAGIASGGDYFDLAESKSGKSLSIILSNSSSYGLSSTVLAILLKVTLKLSQEQEGGIARPSEVLKRVYDELLLVLGEKDQLSLFYGTITRQDLILRYVHLGKSSAYFAPPKQGFTELPKQGGPICKGVPSLEMTENEIELLPEGRLALISGGFDEMCGGSVMVQQILQAFRPKESVDTLNELVFKAKSNIAPDVGMPNRDCSAVIFDVEARTLRSV